MEHANILFLLQSSVYKVNFIARKPKSVNPVEKGAYPVKNLTRVEDAQIRDTILLGVCVSPSVEMD